MFFVMSGFLLSASFERNSQIGQYFRNRLARIYPGLWMCLILTVILFSVMGGMNFFRQETVPWIAAQGLGMIYTPEFMREFGYGSYNGSLWTIVIELQFYICLPLIYWLYVRYARNKGNNFFYALFAISVLVAFFLYQYTHDLTGSQAWLRKLARYSILPHAYIFVIGILLQRWKLYESKLIRGKALIWAGIFLAFSYLAPDMILMKIISMIILAFCTISFAYSAPGFATPVLKNRDISYGVYLYHGMLLSVLVERQWLGSVWYLIGVATLTFLLAWLSYKFIEQPAMTWAKGKKRAATPGIAKVNEPTSAPGTVPSGAMQAKPIHSVVSKEA